jgi:hypothetical protein
MARLNKEEFSYLFSLVDEWEEYNYTLPTNTLYTLLEEVYERRKAVDKPVGTVLRWQNEGKPWMLEDDIAATLRTGLDLPNGTKLYTEPPLTSAERKRLEELEAKFARLPADWEKDSSLETWLPLTAERLAAYEQAAKESVAEIKWDGTELSVQNVADWFSFGITKVYTAPVITDGWKLVPIYATADMSHAGHEYYQKSKEECGDFTPTGMYNAMLNASPDYTKGN